MSEARLVQERVTEEQADGTSIYRIISTLMSAGDLPDAGSFVFQILDENDTSQDQFTRVATVGDLSNMSFGREQAVSRGEAYYRVSGLTLNYDSFSAAQAAATTIRDRVNNLVSSWEEASEDWFGSKSYALPLTEITVEEAYTNAYTSAYQDYVEALIARDTTQDEL